MEGILRVGTTLSHKYRIERLVLERHGVQVYEASDANQRLVGIKIIRRELLGDAIAFARFQLEAWETSVIDFGSIAGVPYFVTTEYERVVTARPPPPPPRPSIPIYVEIPAGETPRARAAWPWIALLVLASIGGAAGGWYAGHHHAHTTATAIR